MTIPGFGGEAGVYQSRARYFVESMPGSSPRDAVLQPQFRSQVRRQCGRCVNGSRSCVLVGYECTVEEGTPGSPELGIPGTPGHVQCEPEIFREWELPC
jgi:hypothetical protein